jgi:hypothetical protein
MVIVGDGIQHQERGVGGFRGFRVILLLRVALQIAFSLAFVAPLPVRKPDRNVMNNLIIWLFFINSLQVTKRKVIFLAAKSDLDNDSVEVINHGDFFHTDLIDFVSNRLNF